jgi:hypothetical protein
LCGQTFCSTDLLPSNRGGGGGAQLSSILAHMAHLAAAATAAAASSPPDVAASALKSALSLAHAVQLQGGACWPLGMRVSASPSSHSISPHSV